MTMLLELLWFLLPAAAANLIPPVAAQLLPRWNMPLDGGMNWRGTRLLGSHKTVRGLVTGMLVATIVHHLQVMLGLSFTALRNLAVDPAFYQTWWLGTWMGFCALAGDAAKSLVKRQLHLAPGRPWLPWDKIDWIIGTLAGCWLLLPLSLGFSLAAIATGLVLSTLGKVIGYWLNINKTWL